MSESASVLGFALVVALAYLALVRFVDMNEREPIWSIGLLFAAGVLALLVVNLVVDSRVLELTVLPGALVEEVAKFVAIGAGVGALGAVARLRGWSEIQGTLDGVVYGVAAGLGFATGETVLGELRLAELPMPFDVGPLASLWTTALSGLAHGVFAAITGAGIGAAARARGSGKATVFVVAGLAGAVIANVAYRWLAQGGALEGSGALIRTWIALILPLLLLVGLVVYELGRERRAIRDELEAEKNVATVSEADLEALRSFTRRQAAYLGHLMRGDVSRGAALMALHNRQVQLALAKRRERQEPDPEQREEIRREVEQLRVEIRRLKGVLAGQAPAAA